jgi:branched-chain amino acid transport system substrate-binding protein
VDVNLESDALIRRARRGLPRFLPVALLLLGCSGRSDPILIGIAGPVGEARGISARRGAQLAVEQINGAGGIDGRPLGLLIKDDSARVDAAVRVAREFYDDQRVVALLGHLRNETTLATAPIYNTGDDPLVEFSLSARTRNVTGAGPFTFGIGPTYQELGDHLAVWARTRFGVERAAILYRSDDDGRSLRSAFSATFQERGGTVVAEHPHVPAISSVAPFMELLRTRGTAEVLVVAGAGLDVGRILALVDSLDLGIPVLGGSGLSEIGDWTMSTDQIFIANHYVSDQQGPTNAAFVNSYRTAYDGSFPDHWGAAAYDAVHLLGQALGEVGPNRKLLRDYLARVGTELPSFRGVTGTISFDENGAGVGLSIGLSAVSNRRLVTVRGS